MDLHSHSALVSDTEWVTDGVIRITGITPTGVTRIMDTLIGDIILITGIPGIPIAMMFTTVIIVLITIITGEVTSIVHQWHIVIMSHIEYIHR